MSLDNRWRCNVCETLNEVNRTRCIVCGLGKECKESSPQSEPPKKRCAFHGCTNAARANEKYCDYHYHTICPICGKNSKEPDQGFCNECGVLIVADKTRGLRRINTILTVSIITFSVVLLALVLLFFLYLS